MGSCVSVGPEEHGNFTKSLIEHQEAQDEYKYLSNITHFDENTLRLLHLRFNAIDCSIERDSRISLNEFAKIICMSPSSILVCRFFKYMDVHNLGGLTFRIFATTMSILSKKASQIEKIKLSFYLYDLNDDGYIDKNELYQIIKDCLPEINIFNHNNKHKDKYINIIIQNTFKQLKCDKKISFKQYQQFIINSNESIKKRILSPFSLDINKLIQYEAESRRLRRYSQESISKKELHHGPLSPLSPSLSLYEKAENKIYHYLHSDKIERVESIHDAWDISV